MLYFILGIIIGLFISFFLYYLSKKDVIKEVDKVVNKIDKKVGKDRKAVFIKPIPKENIELFDDDAELNFNDKQDDKDDL